MSNQLPDMSVYGEAVDIYPCPYTYEEVERENDENDDNDINDDEEQV